MTFSFSSIDEINLRRVYSEFGLRAAEIGEMIGLTESAILWHLKKYGIPTNPKTFKRLEVEVVYTGPQKSKKRELTPDLLRQLYAQHKTDAEIGSLFGMTGEGVAYRRKKLGVSTRTETDRRVEKNHLRGLKDIEELTKDELEVELANSRGIKGVARKYNSTFTTVSDFVRHFGIHLKDVLSRRVELTDLQRRLIIGGLLGDGGVYMKGLGHYYYKEAHCLEQLDYLKWKKSILEDLVVGHEIKYEKKVSPLGADSFFASFVTNSFVDLQVFRDEFYWIKPDGTPQKLIPEKYVAALDAFTLAVWYFDDGYLNRDGNPCICSGSPKSDVERAVELFNDKWSLDCAFSEGDGISFIEMRNRDAFYNLIKDHIHPCFYYKIPVEYRFRISGIPDKLVNLDKVVASYTPKEWSTLDPAKQDEWVNNVAEYYSFLGFPFYKIKKSSEMQEIIGKLQEKTLELCSDSFVRVDNLGSELASSYFPNMWAAVVHGKRSVYNNYQDSDKFRHMIRNVFKYQKRVDNNSIRAELRHCSTVHNFKPLIAKTLYDLYCPEGGTVLDFSAGYGARLLGAFVSSRVQRYIGVDPCQQTFFGLRKLNRRLERYIPGKLIELHNRCAEDPSWYPQDSVDMCFSSPPYFDAEKYSDEDTQSYLRYPTIDKWVDGFLRGTVKNCLKALKMDGFFILNIGNISKHELQRYAYDVCVEEGLRFVKTHLMIQPQYFSTEKYEPIFVFQKGPGVSPRYDEVLQEMGVRFVALRDIRSLPIKRQREEIPRVLDKPFYQEDMARITEKERIEILEALVEYYWGIGFPYPHFSEEILRGDFTRLCVKTGPEVSSVGSKVCNHFVHSRYSASRFDRPNPIKKFWGSKDSLRVFLNNRLQHFDGRLSDTSIRTGVALQGLPANFNPGLAKYLYGRYGAGCRALDFSAGYGGRLLGFLANGVGSYYGVDPNPASISDLRNMADLICPWSKIPRDQVVLQCGPFEDCNIEEEFDIVMSSPPYFKLESYSDDAFQSISRYPEYSEWLDRFWKATLTKSLSLLKNGGHLVFSLSNYKSYDLIGDTKKFLGEIELVAQHSIHLHNVFRNQEKEERVFVYRKTRSPSL